MHYYYSQGFPFQPASSDIRCLWRGPLLVTKQRLAVFGTQMRKDCLRLLKEIHLLLGLKRKTLYSQSYKANLKRVKQFIRLKSHLGSLPYYFPPPPLPQMIETGLLRKILIQGTLIYHKMHFQGVNVENMLFILTGPMWRCYNLTLLLSCLICIWHRSRYNWIKKYL